MKSDRVFSCLKYLLLTVAIICVCPISRIFFETYPDNLIPFNIAILVCTIAVIKKKLHKVFCVFLCSAFLGANNLLSWTRDKQLLIKDIPSAVKGVCTTVSAWIHNTNLVSAFVSENIAFFALPFVICVIGGALFYFIEKPNKRLKEKSANNHSNGHQPEQDSANSSLENSSMSSNKADDHRQINEESETNKNDKKKLVETSLFVGLTLFILFCVMEALFYIKKNQGLPFSLKDSFIAVSDICIPSLIFVFGFSGVVCAIMISVYVILSTGRKIIDAIKHSKELKVSEIFDRFGFLMCFIIALFIVFSITADETFMEDVPYLHGAVQFIRSIITVSLDGDGEGYSSLAQTAGMGIILVLTVFVLALLIYIAMMIFLALMRDRTQLLKTEIEVYSITIALQCTKGLKDLFKFVVDTVCGVIGTLRFLPSFIKSFNNLLNYEDGDEMKEDISEEVIREILKKYRNGGNGDGNEKK